MNKRTFLLAVASIVDKHVVMRLRRHAYRPRTKRKAKVVPITNGDSV
jgi:hypothetical protein